MQWRDWIFKANLRETQREEPINYVGASTFGANIEQCSYKNTHLNLRGTLLEPWMWLGNWLFGLLEQDSQIDHTGTKIYNILHSMRGNVILLEFAYHNIFWEVLFDTSSIPIHILYFHVVRQKLREIITEMNNPFRPRAISREEEN